MTEPANDQARSLRRLVRQSAGVVPRAGARGPRLFVLSGGKGGVGTTTVAVQLAAELQRQGRRTVLVDADPEGGDVATLLDLEERHTVADVLAGRRTVEETLQAGPGGVRVLPGAWGLDMMADCSPVAQDRLLEQLALLDDADAVVLDAGGGTSRLVRAFWQAADAVLVVTTPDLTAVMDAYASIKILAAGDDLMPLHLAVNRADDTTAREAHARLARACRRFLGLDPQLAGHVPDGPHPAAAKTRDLTHLANELWGEKAVEKGETAIERLASK